MTERQQSRLTALAIAAVTGVGLWQALKLDRWGFDGPDAGFFPQLVGAVCVLLALLVAAYPGRTRAGDEGEGEAGDEGPVVTRDVFAVYCGALVALAAGAMFMGFAPTAVVVTVMVMRFAERRSWRASLTYGVICAMVGLVLFGWLLRVDLPEGPIERFFYSLVR